MSSGFQETPNGEVGTGRVAKQPLIDLASVEHIVSMASVAEAWKKVKSNKGAPGVDGISIEKFPKWGRPKWKLTKESLLAGTFRPRPALRVEIPKESGGVRKLGIPCVLERVIMQSIAKVFESIFNTNFSDFSYGYRPGRSVQQAARQAQIFYQQGYKWQIDIDLEKFFDTVNHDVLMERVARKVRNKGLLKLIGSFLRAGVEVDGRLQETGKGVPQGSPISPILSNILLDDFDKELERRGLKFVRYADDFVIFVRSERSAERVFSSVQRYLTQVLKLVVNEQKSSVRLSRDCEYLGFAFTGKRVTITVAQKKLKAFKRRVKELTGGRQHPRMPINLFGDIPLYLVK